MVVIDVKKVFVLGEVLCWEIFIYGGCKFIGLDVVFWVKKMEDLGVGEIFLISMD